MKKICVIAPANTMADIPSELLELGKKQLRSLGFKVVFGKNICNRYFHTAGTVDERVSDIIDAFTDPSIFCVMAVFGGYNTNQLLDRIDPTIITNSGKKVIGYSDFTAFLLAFQSFQNIDCFHGPGFASFCDPKFFDYTKEYFLKVINGEMVKYTSPKFCADDLWYLKKKFGPREKYFFSGWKIYKEGVSEGSILGGNIETITRLVGTRFFPDFTDTILFLEDATGKSPGAFHRDLTQLRQIGIFSIIRGLIIGKFPKRSPLDSGKIVSAILDDVIERKYRYPILYDVNCSHVDPMMTIPLKKYAKLFAHDKPMLIVNYREN